MRNNPNPRKFGTALFAAGLALGLGAASLPLAPTAQAASSTAGMQDYKGIRPADWLADVDDALDGSLDYVQNRVANKASGEKLAVVFDIDDTSLATDFAKDKSNIPAIGSSLALAKKADSLGVKVFFVSNRLYDGDRTSNTSTKQALSKVGYPVFEIYHQSGERYPVQQFKTASRQDIEDRGYTIIANTGNRQTDLDGGYAEKTYKLPDYDGVLQ
ncbi:HAD family acid phosphatase [Arthrobacter russicus]|jgi:predicted secreted acid phosphatase|uniref:Secreted acid phosphatase n=1 Tax=Arthrobacter russicus TaxID=172040 RepID=A0ABU1JCR0_9MICC|nr:HAD family acid phosphatase [Arthrobacter russicus]MDR6269177.1 putative secreted acid phosphatase [Arthrobacter russicus]